jgi:hypothetical protein
VLVSLAARPVPRYRRAGQARSPAARSGPTLIDPGDSHGLTQCSHMLIQCSHMLLLETASGGGGQ